eukprot:RCo032896
MGSGSVLVLEKAPVVECRCLLKREQTPAAKPLRCPCDKPMRIVFGLLSPHYNHHHHYHTCTSPPRPPLPYPSPPPSTSNAFWVALACFRLSFRGSGRFSCKKRL